MSVCVNPLSWTMSAYTRYVPGGSGGSTDVNLAESTVSGCKCAITGGLYIDAKNNRHYQVERHFVADWLRVMQFQGRLHHPPMPEFTQNADAVFRKSGLYPLIEPFDLKGVGGISFRYLDLLRQDDTWLYLPMLRRVRRMSSAQRSDAGHRKLRATHPRVKERRPSG